jgi:hypothetical protein
MSGAILFSVMPPCPPVVACALLAAVSFVGLSGATHPSKSSGHKSTAVKAAVKAAPKTSRKAAPKAAPKASPRSNSKAGSKAAPKSQSRSSSKSKTARRRAPVVRRVTPQQPDADRIREIQHALSAHGYAVEESGVWGPETVDALRRFQEAQNITNLSGRGKLDSLTLIALGLGPQREPPPAPAADAQASMEGNKP